jgi:hypothetical protein
VRRNGIETEGDQRAPEVRVVAASSCAVAVATQPPSTVVSEFSSRRAWASVGAVALGAFIIVVTETLPVGLLPRITDTIQ